MIRVNLLFFITVLISVPIVLVFLPALFYTSTKEKDSIGEMGSLQQCPYCAQTFRTYDEKEIIVCPQCHSLIDSSGKIS